MYMKAVKSISCKEDFCQAKIRYPGTEWLHVVIRDTRVLIDSEVFRRTALNS